MSSNPFQQTTFGSGGAFKPTTNGAGSQFFDDLVRAKVPAAASIVTAAVEEAKTEAVNNVVDFNSAALEVENEAKEETVFERDKRARGSRSDRSRAYIKDTVS